MEKLMKIFQTHFAMMCATGILFRSSITGHEVWGTYLSNFKNDPVFRDPKSSEHNCNHCNNFIRRYGNIVAVDDNGDIITMFDIVDKMAADTFEEYSDTFDAMHKLLKNAPIADIFVETYDELNSLPYEACKKTQEVFRLGVEKNHKRYTKEEAAVFPGVVKANEIRAFHHFYLDLPAAFVDKSGSSAASIMGEHKSAKDVFQRTMEEISLDTLELVRDLILQGSLFNGDTYIEKVKAFIEFKKEYDELKSNHENWCWIKSHKLPFAKFKNELIGVFCTDLAEGVPLKKACKDWNYRVDPENFMKAVAPITEAQKKRAQEFVEENGYLESFNRRFATLDDIMADEIKHMNVGDGTTKVSIFDKVTTKSTQHKKAKLEDIQEMHIEAFMKDVLPHCTSIEALLENRLEGNMVTMTTADNPDSKRIFKWDNNFSWTNKGNLAGKSQLAKMVEAKGGRINGAFRFTHSWNRLERNQSLMDLHLFLPGHSGIPTHTNVHDSYGNNERVGWNHRNHYRTKGTQDVDHTSAAAKGFIPVENIVLPDMNLLKDGKYGCWIHNWSFRSTGGKGEAEIAFGNQVYQYVYPATKHKEWVHVADCYLKNGQFTIEHHLEPLNVSKKIYHLDSEEFHKVNLVCLSPNYWGENAVGHKHYFFMLENCHTTEPTRSFHNENLNSELTQHRKVLDVLGEATSLEPQNIGLLSSHQKPLAGIGFNATVRDELIVKLGGSHKRIIKLKF